MLRVFIALGKQLPKNKAIVEDTQEVARLLAKYNCTMVQGGAKIGLMGMAVQEFQKYSDEVVMIVPEAYKSDLIGTKSKEYYIVEGESDRMRITINTCDMMVVLPGGSGTMAELSYYTETRKSGEHQARVVVVNTNGYYNQLFKFHKNQIKQGLMKDGDCKFDVIKSAKELEPILQELITKKQAKLQQKEVEKAAKKEVVKPAKKAPVKKAEQKPAAKKAEVKPVAKAEKPVEAKPAKVEVKKPETKVPAKKAEVKKPVTKAELKKEGKVAPKAVKVESKTPADVGNKVEVKTSSKKVETKPAVKKTEVKKPVAKVEPKKVETKKPAVKVTAKKVSAKAELKKEPAKTVAKKVEAKKPVAKVEKSVEAKPAKVEAKKTVTKAPAKKAEAKKPAVKTEAKKEVKAEPKKVVETKKSTTKTASKKPAAKATIKAKK